MIRLVHLPLLLLGAFFCLTGHAQAPFYNTLSFALDDPSVNSISFYPEDVAVPEFIARWSSFQALEHVQIKRLTDSQQSKLVLATLSNKEDLKSLHLEINSFDLIPPYLDQFDGLQVVRISPIHSELVRAKPLNFMLQNSGRVVMLELHFDRETALDYLDLFFKAYPSMAQTVTSFAVYTHRKGLERIPRSYSSFTPILLPRSTSVRIDPTQAAKIVTHEGSVISIPTHAFVDQGGNIITDSIQVDFTYFKDQLDIALGQISMEAKSDNGNELLESAGMFEINASTAGQFLALAPEKRIQVDMASSFDSTYNLYAFNDNDDQWEMTSSGNEPSSGESTFTEAYLEYSRRINDISVPPLPEEVFARSTDLFASRDYVRFDPREETPWDVVNTEDDDQLDRLNRDYRHAAREKGSDLPFITFERESPQYRALRDHHFFQIGELNRALPELRKLGRHTWYTAEPMSSGTFRKHFIRHKAYADFRLTYEADRAAFRFILKDVAGEFDTLFAVPFPGRRHMDEDMYAFHQEIIHDYDDEMEDLTDRITRELNSAERKYARLFQKRMGDQVVKEKKQWESIKGLMTPAEAAMSFEEWHAHYENTRRLQQQLLLAQGTGRLDFVRSVTIDDLGYWNCDRPILNRSRFEDVQILAGKSRRNEINVSVLFMAFNTSLTSGALTKRDRRGDCAYILFNENGVSWITSKEAKNTNKGTLNANRPFIPIADVNLEQLRSELYGDS